MTGTWRPRNSLEPGWDMHHPFGRGRYLPGSDACAHVNILQVSDAVVHGPVSVLSVADCAATPRATGGGRRKHETRGMSRTRRAEVRKPVTALS
jgi:hypothetical protein